MTDTNTPAPETAPQWPAPLAEAPDMEDVKEWYNEGGGCESTDGCWVEPDGVCRHGYPSWLLYWNMI